MIITISTEEVFKNEIKTLTNHRRQSKSRSRELSQKAGKLSKDVDFKPEFWREPLWSTIRDINVAAINLRYSKSNLARHTNIAYGLLRGVPYKSIEAKCITPPDPDLIHKVIKEMAGWAERRDFTLEKIKELLK